MIGDGDTPLTIFIQITMSNSKYIFPGLALAVIMAAIVFAFAGVVRANPFYTGTKAQSANATSTQFQLIPGRATSTTVYDAYEQYGTNQPNSATIVIPDALTVFLDGLASSTAANINVACEFSENYNGSTGNGDWYQDFFTAATTTNPGVKNLQIPNSFTATYASSTVGGAPVTASTNRFQKAFQCPVSTRFTRVVVSSSVASTSVWVQIIPKKQKP